MFPVASTEGGVYQKQRYRTDVITPSGIIVNDYGILDGEFTHNLQKMSDTTKAESREGKKCGIQ